MSSIFDINTVLLVALTVISIFGIILSAWSVDTFRKLKDKNATVETCKVENANGGLTFSAMMLTLSLIVFIYCCAVVAAKGGYLKMGKGMA